MRTSLLTLGAVLAAGLSSCLFEDSAPAQEKAPERPNSSQPSSMPSKAPEKADPTPAKPPAKMPEETPAVFKVRFETTAGPFTMECHREWSPLGADRFYELVKTGFYKDIGFFRVMPSFMVQFGIHGDPETAGEWRGQPIADDPKSTQSNTRGMVSFAKSSAPNSRTTQIFINYRNNGRLDGMGFTPFAKVIEGMDNVSKIYNVGERPAQQLIQGQGNKYLKANFPDLDYILSATYVQ